MSTLPPRITLSPPTSPLPEVRVQVPGSKSLTNRALAIAALAEGTSVLTGVLNSEDTRVFVESLQRLGFDLRADFDAARIEIEGRGGTIPATEADLFLANSGTSLRFLTALVSLGRGRYRLDGTQRMRERPIADLLAALSRLGASARSEAGTGCPPVIVDADGLDGGYADLKGDVSSQFLSALLMSLPRARGPSSIMIAGRLVSVPYIAMTLAVMEAFGVRISNRDYQRFNVEPGRYRARTYPIEPDASAASYFFASAAVLGNSVTVEGLGTASIQGDMGFVDILEHMGCRVDRQADRTTVVGGPLRGVDVDMNAISDTVMTLAVVALFAEEHTRIRNVGHIRHKETDRISAVANELRKLGAEVDEQPDGLVIFPPSTLKPASIATYNDHRMAMAFALAGLRQDGVVIEDPACVGKTYPGFWTDWTRVSPGLSWE